MIDKQKDIEKLTNLLQNNFERHYVCDIIRDYSNHKHLVKYYCPIYKEFKTVGYYLFKKSCSCTFCKNQHKTLKIVQSYLDENLKGYKVTKTRQRGSHKEWLVQCPNNHVPRWMLWSSIKDKCECRKCKRANNWNLDKINKIIHSCDIKYNCLKYIHDDSYKIKIYMKCPNPNHKPYWIYLDTFRDKNVRCNKCRYDERMSANNDCEIINYCENLGYKVLDIYRTSMCVSDIFIMLEDKYGYIYKKRFRNFKKSINGGLWHPEVMYHNIKNYCKLNRPDYDIIDIKIQNGVKILTLKYNGNNEYILNANPIFSIPLKNFISGVGHPMLCRSRLEMTIHKFLDTNHINYEIEKTFDDLFSENNCPLRFDFYLPNNNICIEVDGKQHFESLNWFGGNEGFISLIERDKLKDEYCNKKNIKLIRIPYWDIKNNNYKKILREELGLNS